MKALDKDGLDYVVDKIYDVVNSGGSADYIVEEGQSGIWIYRKWASGIAECWGTPTASEIASGSLYVDNTYALPIEFLNNNYVVTFGGVTNTSAQRNVPVPTVYSMTTTSLTVRKWRNINDTSGGASPSMSINIHGLWKEFTPSVMKSATLDTYYPVGSIYISANASFDPNVTFGGTWTKLMDKFLVGAGSTYTLGATGGEATHTLTAAELPPHSHPVNIFAGSGSINGGTSTYANASRGGSQYSAFGNTSEQQGKAHNNLPPYQAVNMWLRTA